jgi:hypothetical protein
MNSIERIPASGKQLIFMSRNKFLHKMDMNCVKITIIVFNHATNYLVFQMLHN